VRQVISWQVASSRRVADSFVLCHSVCMDWHNPILATKERDLMLVGAGVGGYWNESREREWFFIGYGPTEIDSLAIAFDRYERIVVDIAEYGEGFFDVYEPGDPESDRKLKDQFVPISRPANVVATMRLG
jgi:spectinomycin phosphotransferase